MDLHLCTSVVGNDVPREEEGHTCTSLQCCPNWPKDLQDAGVHKHHKRSLVDWIHFCKSEATTCMLI